MELIMYSLRTIARAMVEPTYLMILICLSIIFYIKNRKISMLQKLTIGESIDSPLELTLSQIVLGIIAGAIGSILISLLGITFESNSGIELLFVISLILLFAKPRFVCFAYSGAVLGTISIIFSLLSGYMDKEPIIKVSILSLMTFVGILHIIEGFLVMVDGSRGAVPVFRQDENNIVGGFALKRYWALPIAVMLMANGSAVDGQQIIVAAKWWPIINRSETLALLSTAMLVTMPFYGVLGYSSVTFTKEKKEKALSSGKYILLYGISVVAVSQLSNIGIIGQIVVLIYVPFAHEFMLKYQRKSEKKNECLYISDDNGIAILEVAPNSHAFKVGIRRGDKIVAVNGAPIINEGDIFRALRDNINGIPIKVRTVAGNIVEYFVHPKNKRLGVLLVPKMEKNDKITNMDKDEFRKILEELKNKKQ